MFSVPFFISDQRAIKQALKKARICCQSISVVFLNTNTKLSQIFYELISVTFFKTKLVPTRLHHPRTTAMSSASRKPCNSDDDGTTNTTTHHPSTHMTANQAEHETECVITKRRIGHQPGRRTTIDSKRICESHSKSPMTTQQSVTYLDSQALSVQLGAGAGGWWLRRDAL